MNIKRSENVSFGAKSQILVNIPNDFRNQITKFVAENGGSDCFEYVFKSHKGKAVVDINYATAGQKPMLLERVPFEKKVAHFVEVLKGKASKHIHQLEHVN